MAEPTLSSSSPSNGDSDVYINKNITLDFAEALDSSTVSDETFHLINISSNERENVNVSYDATLKRVTLVLSRHLKENTPHRILGIGNDLAVVDVLKSSDGTVLATSIVVEFSTGDNVYDIDEVIEKEAQSKTLEGDLFLPSNIKALSNDFTILKVRPANHSSDVTGSLNGSNQIVFTFNKDLLTGEVLADWLDYEAYPSIDEPYLYQSGAFTGTSSIPDGTISVSGPDLIIEFDNEIPKNAGIEVQLNNTIKSKDREEYAGNMRYIISTERYPLVFSAKVVRRELRVLPTNEIFDDYIAYLLLKNAIWIWEKTGRNLDIEDLSWAAKKYVLYATIVDLIEDLDFEKYLSAGNRRQVGDLNVSYDSLIGRTAMKAASAKKAMQAAFDTIFSGWDFKTVVRSEAYMEDWTRMWYNSNNKYTSPIYKYFQPDLPISNVSITRSAKTNNPYRLL